MVDCRDGFFTRNVSIVIHNLIPNRFSWMLRVLGGNFMKTLARKILLIIVISFFETVEDM